MTGIRAKKQKVKTDCVDAGAPPMTSCRPSCYLQCCIILHGVKCLSNAASCVALHVVLNGAGRRGTGATGMSWTFPHGIQRCTRQGLTNCSAGWPRWDEWLCDPQNICTAEEWPPVCAVGCMDLTSTHTAYHTGSFHHSQRYSNKYAFGIT